MKKLSLFLAAIVSLLFVSCSSDSESAPAPTSKTKVRISRIELNMIPSNNNGLNWDFSSLPDPYLKLHDETSTTAQLSSSPVWNLNITSENPMFCLLTPPLAITDFDNTEITVQAFDSDSDDALAGDDDYIGEVTFRISDYAYGSDRYPNIVYKISSGTMVTLYLVWE